MRFYIFKELYTDGWDIERVSDGVDDVEFLKSVLERNEQFLGFSVSEYTFDGKNFEFVSSENFGKMENSK